jgi:DivIVA domain-containing protein
MSPLTELDVKRKQFTRVVRGYATQEVDGFLEEVAGELGRLQQEVARLLEQQASDRPGEETIARALVNAQRVADQTVEQATATAQATVAEAQSRAEQITEQAESRARRVAEVVRARARKLTETAEARARELTEEFEARHKERVTVAEAEAQAVEDQARMRIAQANQQMAAHLRELEHSIQALRAFDRDYRGRLRAFVEDQLRALEDSAPTGPLAPPVPAALDRLANGDHLRGLPAANRAGTAPSTSR